MSNDRYRFKLGDFECLANGEVLPGFRMIPFPGHRKHHVGIEVESNGEKLLFAADTVCYPLQIEHIDWQFGGDTDHDIARESHIKHAQLAAESGCLVQDDSFVSLSSGGLDILVHHPLEESKG